MSELRLGHADGVYRVCAHDKRLFEGIRGDFCRVGRVVRSLFWCFSPRGGKVGALPASTSFPYQPIKELPAPPTGIETF